MVGIASWWVFYSVLKLVCKGWREDIDFSMITENEKKNCMDGILKHNLDFEI